MTASKGWGIKSKKSIPNGDFIMEYVGEVVSEKEFKLRMLTEYTEDNHHYCLHLDGGTVIDGHRMGNECRFVNHSCEPNCEMQKWNVNGHYRMALFALRNIKPGEELTYDYNFSLFNPHEGQRCLCRSHDCRGVIGGKTQRISFKPEPSCSHKRKSQETVKLKRPANLEAFSLMAPLKLLTQQQISYVQKHHCFLFRNYEKVRKFREAFHQFTAPKYEENSAKDTKVTSKETPSTSSIPEEKIQTCDISKTTDKSAQTKKLTDNQDDPAFKIAQILRNIFKQLVDNQTESNIFQELPSRKENPGYYEVIEEPLDLSMIGKAIDSGIYSDPDLFHIDCLKVFQNNLRYFGSLSKEGKFSVELRNKYYEIKSGFFKELQDVLETELPLMIFQKQPDPASKSNDDVIDCPCGQYKEEGTMIQCEKCQIWQHLDCVESPPEDPDTPYYCCKCSNIKPSLDIKLIPQPEHYPGDTDYISLLRDEMQVRLGDTVFVLRALKTNEILDANDNDKVPLSTEPMDESFNLGGIKHKMMSPVKGPSQEADNLTKNNYPSYKSVTNPDTADMDIFHVERLWINDKGERFAFGYHYLRPNETFHEPTRKFFRNEVFRVPIYEVLPLDTIWQQCWVMDLATYCKGRPKGALEEHVYICEYRVDKKARLFDKIPKSGSKSNSKGKFPSICTKWFAFNAFDIKPKPSRNFTVSFPALFTDHVNFMKYLYYNTEVT